MVQTGSAGGSAQHECACMLYFVLNIAEHEVGVPEPLAVDIGN